MRIFLSIFFAVCLLLGRAHAVIVEAKTLDPFAQALEQIDQHTLVLFDVDDTLIISKDAILRRKECRQLQKEILGDAWGPQLFSQLLATMEYEVVDPKVVPLIHSLQKRHIRTIAFTKNVEAEACSTL